MTSCPTEDTLGAMLQRALPDDEAASVAAHLDTCEVCRAAALAAVRAGHVKLAAGTPSAADVSAPTPTEIAVDARLRARGRAEPVRGELPAGAKLGRFEIKKLLGAGGMGHVYEAYDGELERSIALKVLRPELADGATRLAERLLRESRMMAKVVHPAVITVHDVGRDGDAVFIAMELVRGQTLAAYVRERSDALDWRAIVALYERAGAGLAAAHAVGLVHRDFKPDNVLVEGDAARVVVTDFGIARATAGDSDGPQPPERPSRPSRPSGRIALDDKNVKLTATGAAIGTPAYMAPEQLAGEVVDLRADVFAFAVSLWEALFGARPFAGATVAAIRESMTRPPQPPRSARSVPPRVIRVLARGLAIDPHDRWPDLGAFTRALEAARSPRKRARWAALGAGVVALGVAGSLGLRGEQAIDPCAAGRAAFAAAYNPARSAALRAALAADPQTADTVTGVFDRYASAWRAMHAATCVADREPIQPLPITACLDARRIELGGVVDDLLLDGPRWARELGAYVDDPARCADPAIALQTSRIPADPIVRRQVTPLRYQLIEAESARDRQDYAGAIAVGQRVVAQTEQLWPPIHAEALYMLGVTYSVIGRGRDADTTLHAAIAAAEAVHFDYTVAESWLTLAQIAVDNDGQAARALEYLQYADTAIERIGRPPNIEALYQYAQGDALFGVRRNAEAEAAYQRAIAIAERYDRALVPSAIQGLGSVYEDEGRNSDAIREYRSALAQLPAGNNSNIAIAFRERLADDLSNVGKSAEAESYAREAVALAEKTLGSGSFDVYFAQSVLSQVLEDSGKLAEALEQARASTTGLEQLLGPRAARYGTALRQEASVLQHIGRYRDADQAYAQACTVLAFDNGDDSEVHAECLIGHAEVLFRLGRRTEALALVDQAIGKLTALGDVQPEIASALIDRADMEAKLGKPDAAIADVERALALFRAVDPAPGDVASAELALARLIWQRDPARAHALATASVGDFKGAAPRWNPLRAFAESWVATDGHPNLPDPE